MRYQHLPALFFYKMGVVFSNEGPDGVEGLDNLAIGPPP